MSNVITTILQVEKIDFNTLLSQIGNLIDNRLNSLSPPQSQTEQEEYLTREQVAKLLQVSETTIWLWCKPDKGILKPYRIGNKVRFKKSEVLQSPKAFNVGKESVQP